VAIKNNDGKTPFCRIKLLEWFIYNMPCNARSLGLEVWILTSTPYLTQVKDMIAVENSASTRYMDISYI